ncbi:glycosyltransferase family 4 protein [Synechocystis sp. FACHB-383]|uniref:glycosyltransferase family 4 protein n=1 Tax=Synechocystis sp. FACHB-383 TaxID=2692864 RepID=UPI0016863EE0|nr:glycosyltransferase family 1 protein [Synechocystis sp. FACHB-383]MBD2654460.1 glycosyltransferase family 4 protein [Synechocystis sp. FACHB-383]
MTKIFYDGEIYGHQRNGGISRYFDNIINRLPSNFTPILTSIRSSKEPHPHHPNLELFSYKRFGFKPGCLSYYLEPYYFKSIEFLSNYQIYHPTYYSLLTREVIRKRNVPIVITVYDMIHEVFAETLSSQDQTIKLKRHAILAADIILCISESTKLDLLERYPSVENKVRVTHLATDFNDALGYGDEPIPGKPFFVYVGGRGGYKNFSFLLSAFKKVVFKNPELYLCVVGSVFTDSEQRQIAELKLDNYILNLNNISDTYLAKLYRHSIAFVYPSQYEGFGIPPLEAMICNTPVIASNTSSIPEVVGDAGLLFNPNSIDELVDNLLLVIDHPLTRDAIVLKGQERLKLFSWDKTLKKTLLAYEDALNINN